jgi:glycosyltransferase involved in cell wall biosynthesis
MPKVSVIIPSYNHEKYVAEAIQSVLDQTFQDFEIVITDDGSSDKTVEVIKNFEDPRIKLFCFEINQGGTAAANNCIRNSTGEFIAMLSSDDVFLPDKLEKQVKFINKSPQVGAVFGYAQIINEEGKDLCDDKNYYCQIFRQENKTRHHWLNHFFYKGNCLCHPSAMIRRECYNQVGLLDERLMQLPDFDFWIRLCKKYEIYIMKENLIKFRFFKDGGNMSSGSRIDSRVRSRIEHSLVLENFLKINSVDEFYASFPEAKNKFPYLDSDLIPFALAKLCFAMKSSIHYKFGIDTLFGILNNKSISDKIAKKYNFTTKDFVNLTGKYDYFSSDK